MTVTDTVRTYADLYDEADESPPQPTRAQLLQLIANMQADWVKLNEFLNATAMHYSWCTSWEERVGRYNSCFIALKLRGRAEYDRSSPDYRGGYEHRRTDRDPYLLPALTRVEPDREAEYELMKGKVPAPPPPGVRAEAADIYGRLDLPVPQTTPPGGAGGDGHWVAGVAHGGEIREVRAQNGFITVTAPRSPFITRADIEQT